MNDFCHICNVYHRNKPYPKTHQVKLQAYLRGVQRRIEQEQKQNVNKPALRVEDIWG